MSSWSWNEYNDEEPSSLNTTSQFAVYEGDVLPVATPASLAPKNDSYSTQSSSMKKKHMSRCGKENNGIEKPNSRRKAKLKSTSGRSPKSTQRKNGPLEESLESTIINGMPENIVKLQDSIAKYDNEKDSTYGTLRGLFVRYLNSEVELYNWLTRIGFTALANSDDMMHLSVDKIDDVRNAMGRYSVPKNSNLKSEFLEAFSQNNTVDRKSSKKHRSTKKKTSSKSRSRALQRSKCSNSNHSTLNSEPADFSMSQSISNASALNSSINSEINKECKSGSPAAAMIKGVTKFFKKTFSIDSIGAQTRAGIGIASKSLSEHDCNDDTDEKTVSGIELRARKRRDDSPEDCIDENEFGTANALSSSSQTSSLSSRLNADARLHHERHISRSTSSSSSDMPSDLSSTCDSEKLEISIPKIPRGRSSSNFSGASSAPTISKLKQERSRSFSESTVTCDYSLKRRKSPRANIRGSSPRPNWDDVDSVEDEDRPISFPSRQHNNKSPRSNIRGPSPKSNWDDMDSVEERNRQNIRKSPRSQRFSPTSEYDSEDDESCGSYRRKSPRTCEASPRFNEEDSRQRSTDSVTRKMNSISLSSASKDYSDDMECFKRLSNRTIEPPPIPDDFLHCSEVASDDFVRDNDDDDLEPIVVAPIPTPAESLLEMSGPDHSGAINIQGSLLSPDNNVMSSDSDCLSPPAISSQLSSQFNRCTSDMDHDDDQGDDNHANERQDDSFLSNRVSLSQGCPRSTCSSKDGIPVSRQLKKGKYCTLPTQLGRSIQTPDTNNRCKSFVASLIGDSAPNEDFSTPNTTTCHVCGQKEEDDFLCTEPALEIELELFINVFKEKISKDPVRESVSPYLFSAMSDRRISDSRGSFAGVCSDEKQIAKEKKNRAFLRRMSRGTHGPSDGPSFNTSTASKMKKRLSIVHSAMKSGDRESKVQWEDNIFQGGHDNLNENSFRGVIVGGTYENCFDNNVPVVSAPSTYEKRVVGVHFSCDRGGAPLSLKLMIVVPSRKGENQVKTVNMGPNWICYKVSTGGFLVAETNIVPYEPCRCYFLSKHPKDWTAKGCDFTPGGHSFGNRGLSSFDLSDDSVPFLELHNLDQCAFSKHLNLGHGANSSIDLADNTNSFSQDGKMDVDEALLTHGSQHSQDVCRKLHVSRDASSPSTVASDGNSEASWYSDDDNEEIIFAQKDVRDTNDDDCALDMSINALSLHAENDDCDFVDWNNSTIVSQVFPYVSYALEDLCAVSKTWAMECFKIRASKLSQPDGSQHLDREGWIKFMKKYREGKFLSAGACKDVFSVIPQQPTSRNSLIFDSIPLMRTQAVSVMDMLDLEARGVAGSISRELEISMLCSSLVSLNICPNLLQVYSTFQSDYPPSSSLWKRENRKKTGSSRSNTISASTVEGAIDNLSVGKYQYIRMEYCASGDLEEVVRHRKGFQAEVVRPLLFQMFLALYSCREQLSMRHYDVKLLNFFCTGPESLEILGIDDSSNSLHSDEGFATSCAGPPNVIDVGFGDNTYSIPVAGQHASSSESVVKLADFGTSSVGAATLSMPITVQQFTTLENTPPEYLFLGSHARECYSADTFGLGLSFLHLLMGEEPYEEHMKDVHCPSVLLGHLKKLWEGSRYNQYGVINEVIKSLDTPDDQYSGGIKNVLYDTFYRYLVLFDMDASGLSSNEKDTSSDMDCPYPVDNPVWRCAVDCLGLDSSNIKGYLTKAKRECIQQFENDRSEWSIHFGTNAVMKRVRRNLSALGDGSLDLLCQMVSLDVSKRCSLHDALISPLFYPLRRQDENLISDNRKSFMHYKNKQFLPIF